MISFMLFPKYKNIVSRTHLKKIEFLTKFWFLKKKMFSISSKTGLLNRESSYGGLTIKRNNTHIFLRLI